MSMIFNYRMVNETELEALIQGTIPVEEFIFDEEQDVESHLDLDKSWHAIHYMLCNDPWEGEEPYVNVVMGGAAINEEDLGYGPVRYLSALEVAAVNEAIGSIDLLDLKDRFNISEMNENEIYPGFDNFEDDFNYVKTYFEQLKVFFKRADEAQMSMLLYVI